MRDLFQVVFELKKKEIELARQHIQSKTIHDHQPTVTLNIKSSLDTSHATYNKDHLEPNVTSKYIHKEVGLMTVEWHSFKCGKRYSNKNAFPNNLGVARISG